jgi:hypothetical protein
VHGSECGAAGINWDTWAELGYEEEGGWWEQSNDCPLILDLNGDGIQTTNLFDSVSFFDPEGNGTLNRGGWTRADTEEAFVWVDLDGDKYVKHGELLGTAFPLPDGTTARNGFKVLQVYDRPENGGNGDGLMTKRDALFGKLLLWVDRNHDGRSDRSEVSKVKQSGIVSIRTSFEHVHKSDGNGNIVMLRSSYTMRHGRTVHERSAEDIGFIVVKD